MLQNVAADLLERNFRRMLRGDNHRIHTGGFAVHIFHRDLRFAVRAEVGEFPALADLGQPAGELVRQRDGQRHQLRRLIAGKAEHHALVARAGAVVLLLRAVLRFEGRVNAERNIRRLHVDGRDHAAGAAVEAIGGIVVANVVDNLPHNGGNIHITFRGDLSHDMHQAGGGRHLARHMRLGIFFQNRVEDGVGDLIADLVGMAFRDGLRGEQYFFHR